MWWMGNARGAHLVYGLQSCIGKVVCITSTSFTSSCFAVLIVIPMVLIAIIAVLSLWFLFLLLVITYAVADRAPKGASVIKCISISSNNNK